MIKFFLLLTVFIFSPIGVWANSSSVGFDINLEVNNCNGDCVSSSSTSTVVSPGTSGGGGWIPPVITISSSSVKAEIVFNVIKLLIKAGDSNAVLSWEVVDQSNYGGVLIKRSELFSPKSVEDGGTIYKGKGDTFGEGKYFLKDTNLKNGKWYFYTVFLFNKDGQYASGASISALPQDKSMKEYLKALIIPPKQLPPELSLPKKNTTTTKNIFLPQNINFIQNSKLIKISDPNKNIFVLNPDTTTTIIIEKKDVPENTESVVATVEDEGGFQTLFLKKDENGNYNLIIPANVFSKNTKVSFTFISEKNKVVDRVETVVKTIKTEIEVEGRPLLPKTFSDNFSSSTNFFINTVVETVKVLRYWILGLVLLIILRILVIHI